MSDWGLIVQEFHTEIKPGAYLEAHGSLSACENSFVHEEEDSDEEAEPEETDETKSTNTVKQYGQGVQDLLNYVAKHHPEAFKSS